MQKSPSSQALLDAGKPFTKQESPTPPTTSQVVVS